VMAEDPGERLGPVPGKCGCSSCAEVGRSLSATPEY
jgi:hypothetical protein